ncbi:MAG: Signal recognition particle core component [Sclerophora amabilis]|nr:MAG: Signal recognition particle core component [Sclerophora amabilis]
MTSALSSVTQSLSSLLRQTTLDDHEEVLKAANAVLKKSKNDLDAQHVRVVALLKLDRYDAALRVLEEGGSKLRERTNLERAYALYKLGRFPEAEEIAKSTTAGRGYKHVEAQATYRLENFPRAAELYKYLTDQPGEVENEENDLRINSSAAHAQMIWAGKGDLVEKKKLGREDLEAFETTFNAACASVAKGELGQAEVLLNRARDLCNALDDLSEDEKRAELLPIMVQQIYVLTRLGKVEEADNLAADLTVAEILEPSTRQIAQNNVLASSAKDLDPYLAHRLFHATSTLPKAEMPFSFQSSTLRHNAYALDLLSLKYKGVARSTSEYLSKNTSPAISADTNSLSVINAAANAQNRVGKAGLKEILPLLEKRPNDVGLLLTIIQLYVVTNNYQSAISLLKSFLQLLEASGTPADQDVRFAPGLIAVLVSLYTAQGRKSQVRSELAKVASHWRHKSKPPASLLRAAGTSLLDSSKPEDVSVAGEIFTSLREQDPNDRLAIAGYIASKATTAPEEVTSEIEKLTPVPRLIAGVDVDALVDAGIPYPPSQASTTVTKKRPAEVNSKPSKKRFRKSRLPKNYDPSKAPDPERWVPLKDRSSYRPKGKKGKLKAAALTQGGISPAGDGESLELAGGAGALKVEKAGGAAGGKAKKKKGKGGKR